MIDAKKIEVFLFDMGNTLLDFHKGKTDKEKDYLGIERLRDYIQYKFYEG